MQAWQVQTQGGIDELRRVELPEEPVGPQEVKIKLHAVSLNYRDLGIVSGGYLRNDTRPVIPLSDGAGEVVEVGEQVTRWQVGDRVSPIFVRDWLDGPINDKVLHTCLGGSIDGVLAEFRVFPEQSLVRIPDYLSYEQAATLPCAAVTAWNALFVSGELQPGQTVLLLGTGGVSMFALQLAKAAGARAIITSSSDEKLQLATEHGAEGTINYQQHPDWHQQVKELTGGLGVDHVIEVGGAGTLERSLKSARVGGQIHLIGVLDSPGAAISPMLAIFNSLKIQGIYVGSRTMFEQMNAAFEISQIKPLIDRQFGFEEAREAYHTLANQKHVGKIVIQMKF